ncbi:MAG: DUF3052 family protein [Solirubrobacterales bacterium]
MTERDYSHRTLADKLGLKPGMRVRVSGDVGEQLPLDAAERVGGSIRRRSELDVAIIGVDSEQTAERAFESLRPTLPGHGAIWIVTRKKGHPDYVKQEDLMPLAKSFDLVDNKICSVDEEHSAIRFVVPRKLRVD